MTPLGFRDGRHDVHEAQFSSKTCGEFRHPRKSTLERPPLFSGGRYNIARPQPAGIVPGEPDAPINIRGVARDDKNNIYKVVF